MERTAAATVPVKITLSGSKRRSRLNVPLKFSQLCQQVRSKFPDVKDFNLQYVDEEGDNIIVTCDADLEEARNVFKDLGKILNFVVNKTAPPPSESGRGRGRRRGGRGNCGSGRGRGGRGGHGRGRGCGRGTADPSKPTEPKKGSRGHRGCHRSRGHRGCHPLVQIMQSPDVQRQLAAGLKSLFTNGSVPVLHVGVICDGSGQNPLVGTRYHKIGQNYDLNETEFAKLTPDEQKKYEAIAFPGAGSVPVTARDSEEKVLLPSNTPFGPGSSGPGVVKLQKVLIQLGHMHPSAIAWHQGLYGPRTTQAVAKVAQGIGCNSGGVFTDTVRAYLLKELKSRPAIHHGITCDGSNQNPLMGVRYHKIGHNYDLNEAEFSKLPPNEQKKYEMISRPGATPVATPVPVAKALDCAFVRDITIPDGQVISSGKQFKKTWLVKTGVTGWPAGCMLTHICGNKIGATTRIAVPPQKPHTLVEVSIDFTAPSRPGKITSRWRVTGPDGKAFGHQLWTTVIVKPSPTAVTSAVGRRVFETTSPNASTAETHHAPASGTAAASASASAASVSAPDSNLQQLIQMGFALPVETLQRVLDSVHGDLRAAITALISKTC